MLGRLVAKTVWFLVRHLDRFPLRRKMLYWVRGHNHLDLAGAEFPVRTDAGPLMQIDPTDYNGWQILINHGMEPVPTKAFTAILRRGDCVLDIGANQGYFTMVAASRVGPEGAVHSFEPNPAVARRLLDNAALNGFQNVTLHGEVVSNACGTVEFHLAPPTHTGLSSMRSLEGETSGAVSLPTITIDSVAGTLRSARLVKIDVEGAELLVLEGMKELLRRDRPFIVMEVTDEWLRKVHGDAGQLFAFLRAQGYTLYELGELGARRIDQPVLDQVILLCAPEGVQIPDIAN